MDWHGEMMVRRPQGGGGGGNSVIAIVPLANPIVELYQPSSSDGGGGWARVDSPQADRPAGAWLRFSANINYAPLHCTQFTLKARHRDSRSPTTDIEKVRWSVVFQSRESHSFIPSNDTPAKKWQAFGPGGDHVMVGLADGSVYALAMVVVDNGRTDGLFCAAGMFSRSCVSLTPPPRLPAPLCTSHSHPQHSERRLTNETAARHRPSTPCSGGGATWRPLEAKSASYDLGMKEKGSGAPQASMPPSLPITPARERAVAPSQGSTDSTPARSMCWRTDRERDPHAAHTAPHPHPCQGKRVQRGAHNDPKHHRHSLSATTTSTSASTPTSGEMSPDAQMSTKEAGGRNGKTSTNTTVVPPTASEGRGGGGGDTGTSEQQQQPAHGQAQDDCSPASAASPASAPAMQHGNGDGSPCPSPFPSARHPHDYYAYGHGDYPNRNGPRRPHTHQRVQYPSRGGRRGSGRGGRGYYESRGFDREHHHRDHQHQHHHHHTMSEHRHRQQQERGPQVALETLDTAVVMDPHTAHPRPFFPSLNHIDETAQRQQREMEALGLLAHANGAHELSLGLIGRGGILPLPHGGVGEMPAAAAAASAAAGRGATLLPMSPSPSPSPPLGAHHDNGGLSFFGTAAYGQHMLGYQQLVASLSQAAHPQRQHAQPPPPGPTLASPQQQQSAQALTVYPKTQGQTHEPLSHGYPSLLGSPATDSPSSQSPSPSLSSSRPHVPFGQPPPPPEPATTTTTSPSQHHHQQQQGNIVIMRCPEQASPRAWKTHQGGGVQPHAAAVSGRRAVPRIALSAATGADAIDACFTSRSQQLPPSSLSPSFSQHHLLVTTPRHGHSPDNDSIRSMPPRANNGRRPHHHQHHHHHSHHHSHHRRPCVVPKYTQTPWDDSGCEREREGCEERTPTFNMMAFFVRTTPHAMVQPEARDNVVNARDVRFTYSMRDLWKSYEEASTYGVSVPFCDYDGRLCEAAYVPYLSAIQLFPRSSDVSSPASVFTFVETAPPHNRRPLWAQIRHLTEAPAEGGQQGGGGDGGSGARLEATPLGRSLLIGDSGQVHERSWFSVLWHPIERLFPSTAAASFLLYYTFVPEVPSADQTTTGLPQLQRFGVIPFKADFRLWGLDADGNTSGTVEHYRKMKEKLGQFLSDFKCCHHDFEFVAKRLNVT
ncbi:unnamed protein product [Vitrella brassicaformis CCMP3155]|uniref:Uncharacterized protein n=4 Tax=Vitrella brassicaformis TaxID=1169539 RepID=A0A0G4GEW7_VITBC|nr:unnamed protein product [Vitrella brassicaformis CCMP3155]|eukprot:CEM28065.1 unnamed protein product [Vitrella brassicaformis CCMP3155]